MQYIKIEDYQVNYQDVKTIVDILKKGGIMVFPTDSVPAIGCLLSNKEGIKRIIKLTGKVEKKSSMSLFFNDLKAISEFTQHYSNSIYRAVNRYTPGPYTFIFNGSKLVTKNFENNKKEVGIRIPDHELIRSILKELDEPIISTSLNGDEFEKYDYDLEKVATDFEHEIDLIVADNVVTYEQTTVLDCTGDEIEVIREGKGAL